MDSSIASMRSALRSFGRYVPKSIVLDLMQRGQEIALGGEKREMTIFFSDIEHFTPVAESFSVEKITAWLEEYFAILSETILKRQGTIDKFIGDGLMAFWGAPVALPDHAEQACEAALECQRRLQILNEERTKQGLPPFYTRIGINTGTVFVGNVGTVERMDYTVIGDAVNLAARLEEMNKVYQTRILIGEETKAKLSPRFALRSLGIAEVRGKKEKMQVYELLDRK